MMDRDDEQSILFDVPTPLGFQVRVTRTYWDLITTIKHPVMAGQESIVKDTLQTPAQTGQAAAMHLCTSSIGRNDLIDGSVQWQRDLMVKAF
jgi:hypothetical protein